MPEALAIARRNGVELEDEEFVVTLAPAQLLPADTYARYFALASCPPGFIVPLTMIKNKDDKFCVLLSPSVLDSDDAIVAVLAHEVHEARAVEVEFLVSGGKLKAERLHSLVNAETGVLHCQAWERADKLVQKRHGSGDG